MKGFTKTLFGDARTIAVAAGCILLALAVLHSPLIMLAGAVLPVALLLGAAYLANH